MEKVKYLTNKELLSEIHKSKKTYCAYSDPDHADYDIIVASLSEINDEIINQAKANKASRLSSKNNKIDPDTIDKNDLIFRIMTTEHVPEEFENKRKSKGSSVKIPFPPFKHYKFIDEKITEVCRSHWRGDFETGEFDLEKGKINNQLATMLVLLVERCALRGNWRGYTYNDEMQGHAITHLCQVALQFDESKYNNPFAFYTTVINNCFTRVLNLEKKNQDIRDDILIMNGAMPSYTRQIESELEEKFSDAPSLYVRKKPGRPKAVKKPDVFE